jgi:hypothetical protein
MTNVVEQVKPAEVNAFGSSTFRYGYDLGTTIGIGLITFQFQLAQQPTPPPSGASFTPELSIGFSEKTIPATRAKTRSIDFAAQRAEIWKGRRFSEAEVAALRDAELDGEEG